MMRTRPRSRFASMQSSGTRSVSSVARSPREGTGPVAPRIAIAGVFGVAVIGILLLRLWALTVLGGADYAARADSNVLRRLPIAAPRGGILDRNGRKIVANTEMRQVVLDLQDIDTSQIDKVVADLGRVLAPNPMSVAATTADIAKRVKQAPPGAIEPVLVARDVRRDEVVYYLAEHQADFPGVDVRPAFRREYPLGKTAAHILGQVGEVSQEELDANKALQSGDKIGKSGIEKSFDEYLRGINGYQAVRVDAAGVRSNARGARGLPATPGRNLRLTIDLPLQRASERALNLGIVRAAHSKKGRDARAGAVVAMDPRNGEVLALASAPSYDPNVFGSSAPKDQSIASWLNSPFNKDLPLLNRAIAGAYPPGSIYKAITSIAALDHGFLESPDELLPCPPKLKIADHWFPNHETRNLGEIPLETALETSCDTFFYKLAVHFYDDPQSPLQVWSRRFGLGKATGIDIPGELAGVVPDPTWKKTYPSEVWTAQDRIWKPGDSVNLSIGQGDLLTTPLQMTNVFATLANGGKVFTPHLAQHVEVGGRKQVVLPSPKPRNLNLDPGDLAAVVDGLVAVNAGPNGTSRAAFETFKVPTAGKSGTAEKAGQTDLAWYCGFAPVVDPTIAACAFIDGGGGGGANAAPIVRQMFEQWFSKEGGAHKLNQEES